MITTPEERYEEYRKSTDFIKEYIFPGCCCPSLQAVIAAASAASTLTLVGLEDIGPHYAPTLLRWRDAFVARSAEVRALGFDDRFLRCWDYYFQARVLRRVQTPGVCALRGPAPARAARPGWRSLAGARAAADARPALRAVLRCGLRHAHAGRPAAGVLEAREPGGAWRRVAFCAGAQESGVRRQDAAGRLSRIISRRDVQSSLLFNLALISEL